jgi:hypothetical protein
MLLKIVAITNFVTDECNKFNFMCIGHSMSYSVHDAHTEVYMTQWKLYKLQIKDK